MLAYPTLWQASTATADVVYNQTPTYPSATSAWTSTYDPNSYGSIYTTYDNFTLASTAQIGSLTWQGFSFDSTNLGATATPVQSFNIGFYANAAGTPGALLFSQTISYTETAASTFDFFGNGQTETLYNYTGNLAGGFTASAGTTYWVSVQGVTDYPAFWTWTSGSGGDGLSYQTENPTYGTVATARPGDRALSLSSVPDTGTTALLLGLSLLGLFSARRVRRHPFAGGSGRF